MITFRPIERADLPMLKEWRNSDSVRPYVREYRYLNDSDQEEWYASYLRSRRKADFDQEILLILYNNTPMGVGGFTRIEWRNSRAELTFYLKPLDNDYTGVEEDFRNICLQKLIEKAFSEYGFHKITWPVYDHDPNLALYKSIFDVEAILREEYFWDGRWQSRIYLSKLVGYTTSTSVSSCA